MFDTRAETLRWRTFGVGRMARQPFELSFTDGSGIARNSGARMGGDTIVPLTVVEDGQQTFVVYKCVNPDG